MLSIRYVLSKLRTKRISSIVDEDVIRRLSTNNQNPLGGSVPEEPGYREAFQSRKRAFFDTVWNANAKYEEFIGLADVQGAQRRVKKAEKDFTLARAKERTVLREMIETREKLKDIRERLSHVDYSNTMYLQLASDQHELVNAEERQKRELEEVEEQERDSFLELTTSMRESYEHERARVERTKNWSIIGTVIGAVIGMMGAIYVNRMRTKELLKAIKDVGSRETIEDKIETLTEASNKSHDTTVTALTTVAENISELSNALHIRNLQAMAGFVDETMNDRNQTATPQEKGASRPYITPTSIQALTDEISSYNAALTTLVNAVAGLSNAGVTNTKDYSVLSDVENSLKEQFRVLHSLHSKINEVTSFAHKTDWVDLSARLDQINKKLSSLTLSQGVVAGREGPVIYELPDGDIDQIDEPNWSVGVKDTLLWGSMLCWLYLFIKF